MDTCGARIPQAAVKLLLITCDSIFFAYNIVGRVFVTGGVKLTAVLRSWPLLTCYASRQTAEKFSLDALAVVHTCDEDDCDNNSAAAAAAVLKLSLRSRSDVTCRWVTDCLLRESCAITFLFPVKCSLTSSWVVASWSALKVHGIIGIEDAYQLWTSLSQK